MSLGILLYFLKISRTVGTEIELNKLEMKKKLLIIGVVFGLVACSAKKNISKTTGSKNVQQTLIDDYTFKVTEISTDPSYGLSPKNPVEVGSENSGPKNERRYLNALAGPNGETLSYFRSGSCCAIKSDNAMFGNSVMLDNYRVTWEGTKDTISIYINMYDSGVLKAPKGFTIRQN